MVYCNQDRTPHMHTLRTYDFTAASRKVSVNKMAEQVQWLDGQAKVQGIVEKICPKRHIRQNQWQSEWNEMYLNYRSEWCYDYISDYECIFNHPVHPNADDPILWNTLQQFKQQGTKISITNLAHFTSPASAEMIKESGGFRGEEKKINEDAQGDDIIAKFSWWSPVFTEDDRKEVRDTLEDAVRPFISPQDNLCTLKNQFATSNAFRPNPRRYKSSYFKYNIHDLCYYYGKHFNGDVQFKILGTFGYKQEVMHAVLVCSQANANGLFRAYPEVPVTQEFDNEAVVTRPPHFSGSQGGDWIWRPQATGTEITRLCRYQQRFPLYRRWENVAFAFHIPDEWGDNPENEKLFVPGLAVNQIIPD